MIARSLRTGVAQASRMTPVPVFKAHRLWAKKQLLDSEAGLGAHDVFPAYCNLRASPHATATNPATVTMRQVASEQAIHSHIHLSPLASEDACV